jgi:mRNA interferase MazF
MAKAKILLIDFPFDDFKQSKIRPVLCLTNPISIHDHVIVAFITSNIEDLLDSDYVIDEQSKDFTNSGLKKKSKICLHKLITIPIDLSKRELGFINPETFEVIINKIHNLFK